jgi:porin
MKLRLCLIWFNLSFVLWPIGTNAQSTLPSTLIRKPDSTVAGQPLSDESPVDVRPFEITIQREHLFGDWYGVRTELQDMGITPSLSLEVDVAGNPTGGRSQGITEASNLGLDLLFDLDKIANVKGASFLVQMSERWGNSLSAEYIGNVFTTQQDFGGETFHVVDVAYQQKLYDDRVEFRIGRIGAGDDFLVCPYDYLFMQNGFDGNPVGIFFNAPGMTAYPNATWGAVAKVRPTEQTYLMAGIYNGDPAIRANDHNGADMSLNGPAFAIAEAGLKVNGLPGDAGLIGNYKAGCWYDNSKMTEFGSAYSERGSWGFYGLFDQVLFPFADRQTNRGLGLFGSVIFAPDPSVAQMPFFFTVGIAARGIFPARPADSCGLGVVYGQFSGDLRSDEEQAQQVNPATLVQDHELALELTYRFSLYNNSMFFQPDLQYIADPGGSGKYGDAIVLGCRLGINF